MPVSDLKDVPPQRLVAVAREAIPRQVADELVGNYKKRVPLDVMLLDAVRAQDAFDEFVGDRT